MGEPLTFTYDARIWRRQRLNQWIILLFLPLPFLACTLFTPQLFASYLRQSLVWSGIIFGGLILVLFWYQWAFFSERLETKVVLADDALEPENRREIRDRTQTKVRLPYEQMTHVIVHQDRAGSPFRIIIQGAPKRMEIGDLEDMELFTTTLRSRLSATCQIEQRQNRYVNHLRTPWFLLGLILLLTGILIIASQFYLNIPFLLPLVSLFVGVRYLTKRSLSRSLVTSRQVEVILGSFFLILAVFQTWIELSNFDAAAIWQSPCTIGKRLFSETPCEAVFPIGRPIRFLSDGQTIAHDQGAGITLSTPSAWIGVWTPVLQHDNSVLSFVLSEDRQVLVSLTAERFGDYTVWVWDVPTQTVVYQFHDDDFSLDEFALSPNGNHLAIAHKQEIALIDLDTAKTIATLPFEENVRVLAFTRDGVELIVASGDLPPLVWDWGEGAELYALSAAAGDGGSAVETLAVSPDGRFLGAVMSVGERLVVWDLQTRDVWHQWSYSELRFTESLTFSPDSRFLVAGTEEIDEGQREHEGNSLYFFSPVDGELVKTFFLGKGIDYSPHELDFAPDGQLLAVEMWSAVYILDMKRVVE